MTDPALEIDSYWSDLKPIRVSSLPVELQPPPKQTTEHKPSRSGVAGIPVNYIQPGVSLTFQDLRAPSYATAADPRWRERDLPLNGPGWTVDAIEESLHIVVPHGMTYRDLLVALQDRLTNEDTYASYRPTTREGTEAHLEALIQQNLPIGLPYNVALMILLDRHRNQVP